jgi:hypothetical protein
MQLKGYSSKNEKKDPYDQWKGETNSLLLWREELKNDLAKTLRKDLFSAQKRWRENKRTGKKC